MDGAADGRGRCGNGRDADGGAIDDAIGVFGAAVGGVGAALGAVGAALIAVGAAGVGFAAGGFAPLSFTGAIKNALGSNPTASSAGACASGDCKMSGPSSACAAAAAWHAGQTNASSVAE